MVPESYISCPIISAEAVKHRHENALGLWYCMQTVVRHSSDPKTSSKQHSGIFGQEEFRGVVEEMTAGTTERNVRRALAQGVSAGLWQKLPGRNGEAYRVRMCGYLDVIYKWMRPLESTGYRFLTGLQERPVKELIGGHHLRRQAFVRHCAERPVDHGRSQELIGKECGLARNTVNRILRDSPKVSNYVLVSPIIRGHEWEGNRLHREALNENISYRRRTRRPAWIVDWHLGGKLYVAVVTQTVSTYHRTGKPISIPKWERRAASSWGASGKTHPVNVLAEERRSRLRDGLPAPLNLDTVPIKGGGPPRTIATLGVVHLPRELFGVALKGGRR